MATPRKPYVATTVTLTNANQAYNLAELVVANRPAAPRSAREVNVQIAYNLSGKVAFGDENVSLTDYGFVLSKNDGLSRRWASDQANTPWGFVFVMTDTAGATVSVEIMGC